VTIFFAMWAIFAALLVVFLVVRKKRPQ